MMNTFNFASKEGESLYSQQKQDWELTVAQRMASLLQSESVHHSGMSDCDSLDWSPLVSSVHGVFQTRIQERIAISISNIAKIRLKLKQGKPLGHSGVT